MENKNISSVSIVEAISTLEIDQETLNTGNISELLTRISLNKEKVAGESKKLQKYIDAQDNSNFISNWWNNTSDKIEETNLNLNQNVAALTTQSSELLMINIALCKSVLDLQVTLNNQQKILETQALNISDNNKIILNKLDCNNSEHNNLIELAIAVLEKNAAKNILFEKDLTFTKYSVKLIFILNAAIVVFFLLKYMF